MLYEPGEEFPIGGSRVVRSSDDDEVTLVAAGITVHEALKAADALAEDGISARVVDAYSVKPLDEAGLRAAAEATGGRIVTVEDHWPEGGLGEAVLSAFADVERASAHRQARGERDAGLREAGRAACTRPASTQRRSPRRPARSCARSRAPASDSPASGRRVVERALARA